MKEKKTSDIKRRDFVKGSALAMGGLMAMPVSAGAYAGGTDAIRIGLIGCGGRGTGAAVQALSTTQNLKLVAMADAFRDRLDSSLMNIHKEITAKGRVDVTDAHKYVGFDGYKSVIEQSDVVLIATPPGFRPIHFEAAVEAGKQIFMEKPVATDAAGIRRVLAAAEIAKKKKLNVVVGLQRHYQKVYTEWVERLHNGAIGDIHTAHVYWNGRGVWTRDRAKLEKDAGRKLTEMEYQMRNWYYFNWLCGDHIVEQHIHNLDVGNWVFQDHPIAAHGMGGRQVRTGLDSGEIFDHHFVEYEYANGKRMYSQCRHIPGCMNRVSEAFTGSNGFAPQPGEIQTPNGYTLWKHRGKDDPNPYQVEHDMLFAAIANGEYKYADAENGAIATMTAILGRMATYSGQYLTWDEAINSEVSIMPEKFAWDANPPVMPNKNGQYPSPMPGTTKVI